MAKYHIAHSCGHDAEVNITGTNVRGERERKAGWLAGQPCGKCSAEQRASQRAQAAAGAAARNAAAGLPALAGPGTQVPEAEELRDRALAVIAETIRSHGAAHVKDQIMTVYLRAAARAADAGEWTSSRTDPRRVIAAHMDDQDQADFRALQAALGRTGKGNG